MGGKSGNASNDESFEAFTAMFPASALDCSYALSSTKLADRSFSAGSTVANDSFVLLKTLDDDESDESYDPYLDDARRRRRRRMKSSPQPKYFVERQSTSSTLETSSDEKSVPNKVSMVAVEEMPKTLEIPERLFPAGMTEIPRQRRQEPPSPEMLKAQHERNYWHMIVLDRISHHDKSHVQVADGLLLLGNAHLRCKEYETALHLLHSAVRIYRKPTRKSGLSLAKALDRVGLASCRQSRTKHSLTIAAKALNEAFDIRYKNLGPHHVDTVDTLNNLAGVYLHRRDFKRAKKAYFEVLVVRKAIFGEDHPSVAIASHALGNVYLKLSRPTKASRQFSESMRIYRKLRIKPQNPTMRKLTRDIATLNRIANLVRKADI